MITSQVKGLIGVTGFKGRGFVNVWKGVLTNITSIQWYDTAVGLFCIAVLYFLRVSHILKSLIPDFLYLLILETQRV